MQAVAQTADEAKGERLEWKVLYLFAGPKWRADMKEIAAEVVQSWAE